MIDRRTFIESSVAVALATGTASSAVASDADRGVQADPWTETHFRERIGQRFLLNQGCQIPATLVAVQPCGCDRQVESFHLAFAAEHTEQPAEGLYRLRRPIVGGLDLFLQPRGPDGQGRWILEATVSRLIT